MHIILISLCLFNFLKDQGLPGIEIETRENMARFTTSINQIPKVYKKTRYFPSSRSEVLWVDRDHQNAIAEHVAISGNGAWIQAGWYLNNERTSAYYTFGTSTPSWTFPLSSSQGFIPVDLSQNGDDIGVCTPGEPLSSFGSTGPIPKWRYPPPPGYKIVTSFQGSSVGVSEDGTIYALLTQNDAEGRLYIFNSSGDTIRSIGFDPNSGIYGLDLSDDGSVFCITTYRAIYVFNIDGTRRDSLYHYGQTVAKISGDGNYLVRGDFNSHIVLYRYNGTNYETVWTDYATHPWITAVAISGDGSTIMAGTFAYSPTYAGMVLMYDSSSAQPLWSYDQYGDMVSNCALSSDGQRGVAGSWGQYNGTFGDVITVFVKDSANPLLQVLDDIDESGSIFSVDISDDGSFITAGGKAVHAREWGNGGEVYAIRILDSLNLDVGVSKINIPGPFLQVGQSINPEAVVRNYGTQPVSFNTICNIYDSLNQLLHIDTVFVNNLPPGDSMTTSFASTWTVPAYGIYKTTIFTDFSNDEYPLNDTLIINSICYHDAAINSVLYPFSELTLHYTKQPQAVIQNLGSYAEIMEIHCVISDPYDSIVYTGIGQVYLNPLQSARVALTPAWDPPDTISCIDFFFTYVQDDYNPGNDTLTKTTNITSEIMYDDNFLNIYGSVSSDFYDNKFAEKMIPCLASPYYITRARFYVSNSDPIIMSLNKDSLGLPGLGPGYYIAPAETIYPQGPGWAIKEFSPPILVDNDNPFWFVVHWLSTSPSSPFIGMDNTWPLDSLSYWYWTEPSNPGWHQWVFYDFMMRVYTTKELSISSNDYQRIRTFSMNISGPNPFNKTLSINLSIPEKGRLKLSVYDVAGRLARRIIDAESTPGNYQFVWKPLDKRGRKLSSGIYFIRAEFGRKCLTRKVIYF